MPRRQVTIEDACCTAVTAAPLTEADATTLARGFAALGDPVRLRLFSMLAAARAEVCACEFVEPLGRSQPTISHHLKVLTEAGLIVGERRGRWVWYHVVPAALDALRDFLSFEGSVSAK
jgi:ArsR family transcriptional regulator